MAKIIDSIHEGNYLFLDRIKYQKNIMIGTLGPEGTSSYSTLLNIISELNNNINSLKFSIKLRDNFNTVYEDLKKGTIDYALIPSAYERITDFFWNKDFENVFNFLFDTPNYGIVAKKDLDISAMNSIRFASCPAVENMLNAEEIGVNNQCPIVKIRTSSTTEAAKYVSEGRADIGVTNVPSFKKYESDIEFVSVLYSARIVWSMFGQRREN